RVGPIGDRPAVELVLEQLGDQAVVADRAVVSREQRVLQQGAAGRAGLVAKAEQDDGRDLAAVRGVGGISDGVRLPSAFVEQLVLPDRERRDPDSATEQDRAATVGRGAETDTERTERPEALAWG